jgi:predicted ArsR family transcriptional regulator
MGTAADSEKTRRKILLILVEYGELPIRDIATYAGYTVAVINTHKIDLLNGGYIAERDLGEKMKGTGQPRYLYRALKTDYRSVTPAEVKLANPVGFHNPFRINTPITQGAQA